MADTTTPNLGLLLADLNDTFNFAAHTEANLTTIDTFMGAVKCTSTTRPTTTYGGQVIYETDTGRLAVNSNTKASPTWTYLTDQVYTCTSTTRPTLGLTAGMVIYETNTGFLRIYTGTAWIDAGMPTCTSGARPANPITGDLAYETDTGAIIVYTGSAWIYRTFVTCTSSARPTTGLAAGVTAYETDTGRSIVYSGSAWQQIGVVTCTSSIHPGSPLTSGLIFETDTKNLLIYDGTVYRMIQTGAWTAYTPTWTCSTTNPSLGNGTLLGSYTKTGRGAIVRISLLMGSTTTLGSGMFQFSLPFTPVNNGSADAHVGTVVANNSGVAFYVGAAAVGAKLNTALVQMYSHGGGAGWGATVPAAWTISGSWLSLTICIETTS